MGRTMFDCAVMTLDGTTVLKTFGTTTKAKPETVARHAGTLMNVLINLYHIPVTGEHTFRAEWSPMCDTCCRSVNECGGCVEADEECNGDCDGQCEECFEKAIDRAEDAMDAARDAEMGI